MQKPSAGVVCSRYSSLHLERKMEITLLSISLISLILAGFSYWLIEIRKPSAEPWSRSAMFKRFSTITPLVVAAVLVYMSQNEVGFSYQRPMYDLITSIAAAALVLGAGAHFFRADKSNTRIPLVVAGVLIAIVIVSEYNF